VRRILLALLAAELLLQLVRPTLLDRVRQRAFNVSGDDADFVTLQPLNFDPATRLPLLVYDPDAFWVMAPDRQGAYFLTAEVRTNALGLRGPPLVPRAGDDEIRLLFLGDSVTFGMRVGESERYADVLVEALRAEAPGLSFTAVNAGVIGYSVTQVLTRLPDWLQAAQPDVVLVALGLNDCLLLPASDAQLRSETTSTWERLRHAARASQLVCSLEVAVAWLQREGASLATDRRRPVAHWLHYPRLPSGSTRVPRTSGEDFFAALEEIERLCSACGATLVLVTEHASPEVPSTRLPDPDWFERLGGLCASLREHAARRGLVLADARAALGRSPKAPQELMLDFCHPSPAGHAVMAAELDRTLETSGLLARWRQRAERR